MQGLPPLLAQAIQLSNAGRNAEAAAIVQRLAAQDEPNALYMLAQMKWGGGIVPQDLPQARELYRRAGERGHAAGRISYTNLLANGIAGARDWPGALQRLREEARRVPRRQHAWNLVRQMNLDAEGDPAALPEPRSLSASPEVTLFPGLLSDIECSYLRQVAEDGYGPSIVYDSSGRTVRDQIRTSDGSTIAWLAEDPAVHALLRRLAAASGTAFEQGEALQILRYQPGQQYRRHLDFVGATGNDRVLTALVYLNDDYEGGETAFVRTGLKVKGRRGDAIVFRNANGDGRADPMSEHEGLPVISGIKYLASRWIREARWTP